VSFIAVNGFVMSFWNFQKIFIKFQIEFKKFNQFTFVTGGGEADLTGLRIVVCGSSGV
jgi:hypothetical protein